MPNEFSEALSIHQDAEERVLLNAIPRRHILPSEEGLVAASSVFPCRKLFKPRLSPIGLISFKTGSQCISLAGWELIIWIRLAQNSQGSARLGLLSVGIRVLSHLVWLQLVFLIRSSSITYYIFRKTSQ